MERSSSYADCLGKSLWVVQPPPPKNKQKKQKQNKTNKTKTHNAVEMLLRNVTFALAPIASVITSLTTSSEWGLWLGFWFGVLVTKGVRLILFFYVLSIFLQAIKTNAKVSKSVAILESSRRGQDHSMRRRRNLQS